MTMFCRYVLLFFTSLITFFQGIKLCMDAVLALCFAPGDAGQC
jgi:hypothetical protein